MFQRANKISHFMCKSALLLALLLTTSSAVAQNLEFPDDLPVPEPLVNDQPEVIIPSDFNAVDGDDAEVVIKELQPEIQELLPPGDAVENEIEIEQTPTENPFEEVTTAEDQATAETNNDAEEEVFYDAEAFVPRGEISKRSTRKLDPVKQPASRFVIVKKEAQSSARRSKIVAAKRAVKLGRYSSAMDLYDQILVKNNRDADALLGKAIALQKMGAADEAIFAYESLLDIKPDNTDARVNMLGLMAQKYPAVALRQLEDLRQKNMDNVALIAQIGITHGRLGNVQEALKYLGVAVSMEPQSASHYYTMAVIADRGGMKSHAVKYYEKALEVDTIYSSGRSLPRDSVYARLAKLR